MTSSATQTLHDTLHAASDYNDEGLVQVECEEEVETLESVLQVSKLVERGLLEGHDNAGDDTPSLSKKSHIDHTILSESLRKASEQVVVSSTLSEYRRLWKQFAEFCIKTEYVQSFEALDKLLAANELPASIPDQIAMWIMDKCDEVDLFTGDPKPLSISRHTYAYAQKMRAAMSHKFGRELAWGTQPWVKSTVSEGLCTGNPSLALQVSQYMISLRRRKIRGGQVVTSAHVITEKTVRKLYKYNTEYVDRPFGVISRKRKADNLADAPTWATKDVRMMLNTLYSIAFLCLMRFDEVLHLQWHWITLEPHGGSARLKIQLPWRKTHQTGGIAPFYLYPNREKPWLDAVAAYAQWVVCNKGMPLNGFLFRRKLASGRFSEQPEHNMSAESFLDSFRHNLLDVGIDPSPYGTHSFRRGGCQYLSMELRWDIRRICSWGGWSDNQDTATIFKYLLSWMDEIMDREDFFNPNKQTTDECVACGRKCLCK